MQHTVYFANPYLCYKRHAFFHDLSNLKKSFELDISDLSKHDVYKSLKQPSEYISSLVF